MTDQGVKFSYSATNCLNFTDFSNKKPGLNPSKKPNPQHRHKSVLWIRIRIRIQWGLWIRIQIEESKNDPQTWEKVDKFHFLRCWVFPVEG